MKIGERLMELIGSLGLGAYIIPMHDEHLNEFIGLSDNKVSFLTGFSGTAGTVIATEHGLSLVTDGRYYQEAKKNQSGYELIKSSEFTVPEYLEKLKVVKVGVDPHFLSSKKYINLKQELQKIDIELVETEDLVAKIWNNRPRRQFGEIKDIEKIVYRSAGNGIALYDSVEDKTLAEIDVMDPAITNKFNGSIIPGLSRNEKLELARDILKDDEYLLITELDTIAWLFNLRGGDIPYNQVFYSYAVISHSETLIFVNSEVTLPNVVVNEYNKFNELLEQIKTSNVLISGDCNAFIAEKLTSKKFTNKLRNIQSLKTDTELFGMKLAYILDAIVLVQLYEWIEESLGVSEMQIAAKFEELSSKHAAVQYGSFKTIVGIGENSSSIHHNNTERMLKKDEMVLLDSGNQYLFGTTDITRTINTAPTPEQKTKYTIVLKGVLSAKMATYENVKGSDVDEAVRRVVRETGSDYHTSTGHGVGAGLFVHEHPPSIGSNGSTLLSNQVFTIEPGFYKEDEYGIRIEDTVVFEERDNVKIFSDISLVPIHYKLLDLSMLNHHEIKYLNEYNKRILTAIGKYIGNGAGSKYLNENTRHLDENKV